MGPCLLPIYCGNIQDVFVNQVCLFVCVRSRTHPFLPKKYLLFVCFLFCVEGGCLPITRWLLTLLLPPDPQTAIGCAGPWFFAKCANLAFCLTILHKVSARKYPIDWTTRVILENSLVSFSISYSGFWIFNRYGLLLNVQICFCGLIKTNKRKFR